MISPEARSGWTEALAFALLAAPVAAAELREWPIEVPGPGRFEVALDAAAIEAMTAGGGVELLDPDGEPVAAERFAAERAERCRELEVARLERDGEHWRVRLRVPENAGPHASLRFELEDAVLASDCVLEASDDGHRWIEIGRADLFRIGDDASLARTRFDYEPIAARELALGWPAAAGFPRVRSASVCAPRDDEHGILLGPRSAEAAPLGAAAARYRWSTPIGPVRLDALEIRLASHAPAGLGYRLRAARSGSWLEVARGRWPRGADRLRLALEGSLDEVGEVALDLHGWAPSSLQASWQVGALAIRFESVRAGLHTLRIPAAARSRRAGAEGALSLPLGSPRPAVRELGGPAPGAPLPERPYARSWPVRAEAAAGDPVELTLSPAVLGAARRDLADLRLALASRLVPARLERPDRPVQLGIRGGVAPDPVERGRSRWEVPLPGAERPAEPTQLLLRAAPEAAPFERRLRLLVFAPTRGRRPTEPRVVATETWRCAEGEPVPCELALPIAAPAGSILRVEIDDGDSAAFQGLDLELAGRGARLLFQWPGDGVELFAGAESLAPARYDLARLDAALELASPGEARLGSLRERGPSALDRWSRPLLVAAILLVALVLLLLLRRLLPPARRAG